MILIFYGSSVVIWNLVFHSFFNEVLPLRFQLSCEKSLKYSFITFFFFDCGSLLDLLSLFFWSGVTFPLVDLDEISVLLHISPGAEKYDRMK